jgi:hypothetical protein
MESTKSTLTLATMVAMLTTLAGCGVVRGIFKAGMWVGIIMIALIAGIAFAVMNRARRV